MEIYKDQHEVRRISNSTRFFALCKSLLCGCKFFAQNDAKGLAECTSYGALSADKRKRAFTLAEVLITLGIIGIVAAMTLPALIQHYRNHVAETRLKKFYTTFNQAILLAEAEYGDKKDWYVDARGVEFDDDGNPILESAKIDLWFKKYLKQFIVIKKQVDINGRMLYYLSDGSAFELGVEGNPSLRDISYYIGDPRKCIGPRSETRGRCSFWFEYNPISKSQGWRFLYNKGLEPGKFSWDGTMNMLLNDPVRGCRVNGSYCTALIQLNGWKIPKDYPQKIRY